MEELVRCRPCGYVMRADELKDVCPACGLPHSVFEPYRERVSAKRLFILSLDIHPIAIHLSQTFVALIPVLMAFHYFFPDFQEEIVHPVYLFSIFALPLSLIASFVSGIIDGITRFKTLETPLLKIKMVYGAVSTVFSFAMWYTGLWEDYMLITFLMSLICLYCAVRLGLYGKKLLDVILPGKYDISMKRKKITPRAKAGAEETED